MDNEVKMLSDWHRHLLAIESDKRSAVQKTFRKAFYRNRDEVLEGESASARVSEVRAGFIQDARKAVSQRSTSAWLYLLRTVRLDFLSATAWSHAADDEGDQIRSVMRIAENLAGTSGLGETKAQFDVTSAADVAALLSSSWLIQRSEEMLRSVTKGMALSIADSQDPRTFGSRDLEDAIWELDFRQRWQSIERWEQDLAHTSDVSIGGIPAALTLYRVRTHVADVPTWKGPLRDNNTSQESAQFLTKVWSARAPWHDGLSGENLIATGAPHRLGALLLLSNSLLRFVVALATDAGETLPARGVVALTDEELSSALASAKQDPDLDYWLQSNGFANLSLEDLISSAQNSFKGASAGYPGPIVHRDEDLLVVDVSALTWHLWMESRIDASAGGDVVNEGAYAFELTVQDLIDKSIFAPTQAFAELRGRTLRFGGRAITDIDAIGHFDDYVLLVSCKRFAVNLAYRNGDFRAARNLTKRVNDAVSDWLHKVSFLRDQPIGDNYDFSGKRIAGVVVMPELALATDPQSSQAVEVGFGELAFTQLESVDQFAGLLEMMTAMKGTARPNQEC